MKQKINNRPGVMLYFSVRPALDRLSNEDLGILFKSIMDYAELNTVPDFTDNALLGLAWDFIMPSIDSDRLRYDMTCTQNSYKVFKREFEKKHPDEECPTFESWLDSKSIDIYGYPRMSIDIHGCPRISNNNTTSTSISNSNCNTNKGFASDTDVKEVAAMLMASISK